MSDDAKNPLPMHAPYPGMPISKLFVTMFREPLWQAMKEGKIPGVSLEDAPAPEPEKKEAGHA